MSPDTGQKFPLSQPLPPPPDFGGATSDDMVWLHKRPDRESIRLTYSDCVFEGMQMVWLILVAILVIATLPITLPLAGLGYLVLRPEKHDA